MEFILLCSHKAVKSLLPDLSCSNQKSAFLYQQPSKQEAEKRDATLKIQAGWISQR